ncbi:MAG: BrnT family toxin [Kiritimatiellia bacterium]|nr:BrnT family toxin [Kiritimatiellia bacterium]
MKFEFDPEKSEANKVKHSIDFVTAQALWDDPDRLQVPARTQGEPRWMLIGRIGDTPWSAVFTIRDGHTRIISVRRSRPLEVMRYEE